MPSYNLGGRGGGGREGAAGGDYPELQKLRS